MSQNVSNSLLDQDVSRRTALKALFAAASAAVLFGLPQRTYAAEASQETTDKLNEAQAKVDEVQKQLYGIASEYSALASKNADTLNKIEGVQSQIDAKKSELKKKREGLSDRVAASYKSGGTNVLSLLLTSGSFEEFVANTHYVEKVNKSDRDAISDIQTIQSELDSQKTDLESLKDKQTEQMKSMQSKQAEVQSVLNGL